MSIASMDRKAHWDAIYQQRAPAEVSWYQAEPRLSLELIAADKLPKTARIIDIGGGASVLVDRLLNRGFTNLTVLDISEEALRKARELGDRFRLVETREETHITPRQVRQAFLYAWFVKT